MPKSAWLTAFESRCSSFFLLWPRCSKCRAAPRPRPMAHATTHGLLTQTLEDALQFGRAAADGKRTYLAVHKPWLTF